MNAFSLSALRNGANIKISGIPRLPISEFRETIINAVSDGARISSLFAVPGERLETAAEKPPPYRLIAVLAEDQDGTLSVLSSDVGDKYAALTPDCPQAHWFEREIAEQWEIKPLGHPWLKPIRFQKNIPAGTTEFYAVHGEEVHEVAVGPVHAGIIEPGHFRFQCHGEKVLHLEISLGYQHRGIERAIAAGPIKRIVPYMETAAGDTTIGHATAYAEIVEALSGCKVPARGQSLRSIALELERLANHIGDLGALAGDVGFLPTSSYGGRIRGDFLNMTALLCGSRFGRGFVRPGGTGFDLEKSGGAQLAERLQKAKRDVSTAVNLLWNTPSVLARFENAGVVSPDIAAALGLVGPVARACGKELDVRQSFSTGIYRFFHIPISTWHTGDVFARAYVRWLEIQRSLDFLQDQLQAMPSGPVRARPGESAAHSLAVSLVEGWRGEICHVAITDAASRLSHYKITDPSFHNWMGLAMALRNEQISDFPLCNKSFNLSYCGHDL